MTQIPIYRARKLDSDKWIEGYYFKDEDYPDNYFILDKYCTHDTEIDPSTLAISFDNKKTWRGFEEIQNSLEYYDKYQQPYEVEQTKDNK